MYNNTTNNNASNTMNTTLNLSVANSIVMCYFQCTAPSTNALNRSATSRAANAAGATKEATRLYNTILTTKGTAVGKAMSLQTRTAANIRRIGLPCPTGGFYIRLKDVVEVQNIFDDAQVEMDLIRSEILATYGDITHALRSQLGSFVHEVNIPSATEVASRFTMKLTLINQPAAITGPVLSGLADEVANRVRADSKRQVDEMLMAAQCTTLDDLKRVLTEFADHMRNSQRFRVEHFDKLRDEARRVKGLNVLGIPAIDAVAALAAAAAADRCEGLTKDERISIAQKAESALAKADHTLAALGL